MLYSIGTFIFLCRANFSVRYCTCWETSENCLVFECTISGYVFFTLDISSDDFDLGNLAILIPDLQITSKV